MKRRKKTHKTSLRYTASDTQRGLKHSHGLVTLVSAVTLIVYDANINLHRSCCLSFSNYFYFFTYLFWSGVKDERKKKDIVARFLFSLHLGIIHELHRTCCCLSCIECLYIHTSYTLPLPFRMRS